ncbi:DNA polymerase [Methylobacterium sp. Leaf469]|uniref:UdgX family uracil-DNA binding protein n=1 Tax=Methylobacterium sp. Leaf469 TaxID=1736387 RepID=UPI0006F9F2F8|nr:UdgX family uracil-DNA binding protein [Methylobacterium sp. Leaf469]KQU05637.1 DNA polymerase [Methylobacterium sp. Leaf469]USU33675.1 UdgX family uracil-DNA binding protein [Methylobacterium sp. OTU13CASTA1]
MDPGDLFGAGPRAVSLAAGADVTGFRNAVRRLVAGDVPPERVVWSVGEAPGLFGATDESGETPPLALPRGVADLVTRVVPHRDPERYALLYTLVWRVLHGERRLLEVSSDPLVHRLERMAKAIARDLHKMHAFLRFRLVEGEGPERFVAWFEPDHHILQAAAPFFVGRFRSLHWTILTPEGSALWDTAALTFGPPGRREDAPTSDGFEAGWRDYYESTFNPARTNLAAMRAEMPKKYWRNMPETAAIPGLVRAAASRTDSMIERAPQKAIKRDPVRAVAAMADQAPESLDALNAIIRRSEPLVPGATQAVLGEGRVGAAIAFVGEQPGDHEDRQGRPFVGPAGQLLSKAMAEAGLVRGDAYLTNAVKHFKFEERGKRRIHQNPTAGEVSHYRWWLERELDFVAPRLVVALGATAVLALAGRAIPVTRARGPAEFGKGYAGFITVHPSYLLRLPDGAKDEAYAAFVQDLRRVGELATRLAA